MCIDGEPCCIRVFDCNVKVTGKMDVETQLLAFVLTLAVASLLYLLRVSEQAEDDYAEDIAQLRQQSDELLLETKFWRQKSTDGDAEIEDFRVVVDKFKAVVLTQEDEIKKQKGRAQSAHTSKGQILEKWTPFLSTKDIDDHWRVEDWALFGKSLLIISSLIGMKTRP